MKMLLIRLSVLAAVVGLGYLGITQFYKGFGPTAPAADTALAPPTDAPPKPIPLSPAADSQTSDATNPFARSASLTTESNADPYAATGADPYAQANDGAAGLPADGYPTASNDGQAMAAPDDGAGALIAPPAMDAYRDRTGAAQGNSAGQYREPRRLFADRDGQAGGGSIQGADDSMPAGARPIESAGDPSGYANTDPRAVDNSYQSPAYQGAGPSGVGQPYNTAAAPPDRNSLGGGDPNLAAGGANLFAPVADARANGGQGVTTASLVSGAVEGLGRPGAQQLEGAQSPSIIIEKQAPDEIQVGKPALFIIKVRNAGAVAAHGVEIHDDIPQGTQFISAKPAPAQPTPGKLVWALGSMKPGDEATVQLQLMPVAEGEIGSLATVHFQAAASVKTRATRPAIKLQVSMPSAVMIGQNLTMKINISNPGSGVATGVVLTENVPSGLKHLAGSELELEIGALRPGESRELDLTLSAAEAGHMVNLLTAHGDANLRAEDRSELDVLAPGLKLGMSGPKRRYLERNATFTVSVSNPGTAAARDVELAATLPKGMKFVDANNLGQFDPATNTVYWSLDELPAQETGTVTVTALPQESGDLKLQVRGKARQGLSDALEETVAVDGLAALLFELVDVNDPIEVNGQTSYQIRVINQGSKAANNVRVVVLLPPEMRSLGVEAPVRYQVDGQRILFEPIGQLAPKADTVFTVKAQAIGAGDLRVRAQLMSDEIRSPITKEESTRVFADE
jgi:uncharacterized repeat protein (TIGR01451 family)